MSRAAFADHLRARLGPAAAAPPALLHRLAARNTPPYAAALAPPDAAAVAEALELCAQEGWPVRPAGAGTWLEPRGEPGESGESGDPGGPGEDDTPVLISTMRLNRIVEHEPADLVVGVEAGVSTGALAAQLTRHGQWLPLDPPVAEPATIGAVVAQGSAGPLRAGHGTPRDLALGVRIATGDGRLVHFGGRVVKNVAGYDGVRLTVGSGGTLGVITEVYLRVRGAPRDDRTIVVGLGAGAGAAARGADLALEIRDQVGCDALELVSPAVAAALGLGASWTLVARLTGGEAAVQEGVDRLKWVAERASRTVGGAVSEVGAEPWSRLALLESDAGVAVRLTGRPTSLVEGLGPVAELAEGPEGGWLCAAHAADGVIRVWRPESAPLERATARLPIPAIGGWTARSDRLPVHLEVPRVRRREGVRELTRKIRAVFDPRGILAAGGGQ